jgi:putative transcriptional regulator
MFDELLQSITEGGAILRGENKTARRIVLTVPKVKAVREKTSLSQSEFAHLIGVSVKTLQNWEQDRRRPTGPAVALLKIIAREPKLAVEAIHRH